MKAEIDVVAVTPEIAVSADKSRVVIRCELIDQSKQPAIRSGKHIHLGLPAQEAGKLLVALAQVHEQLGLPLPEHAPSSFFVPPKRDAH